MLSRDEPPETIVIFCKVSALRWMTRAMSTTRIRAGTNGLTTRESIRHHQGRNLDANKKRRGAALGCGIAVPTVAAFG